MDRTLRRSSAKDRNMRAKSAMFGIYMTKPPAPRGAPYHWAHCHYSRGTCHHLRLHLCHHPQWPMYLWCHHPLVLDSNTGRPYAATADTHFLSPFPPPLALHTLLLYLPQTPEWRMETDPLRICLWVTASLQASWEKGRNNEAVLGLFTDYEWHFSLCCDHTSTLFSSHESVFRRLPATLWLLDNNREWDIHDLRALCINQRAISAY